MLGQPKSGSGGIDAGYNNPRASCATWVVIKRKRFGGKRCFRGWLIALNTGVSVNTDCGYSSGLAIIFRIPDDFVRISCPQLASTPSVFLIDASSSCSLYTT